MIGTATARTSASALAPANTVVARSRQARVPVAATAKTLVTGNRVPTIRCLMRSRLFWRRSVAAAGTYSSAVLGFLGTVIALHVFSTYTFGLYALVFAATGLFQSLLDLTVEEALVKFGFRYLTRQDWGRLRRLFRSAVVFKVAGGVFAMIALLAFAPVADALLHKHGLAVPLAIASLIPLAQCTENVGGVAIILRERYDIRALFLLLSMALRLTAIAVGTQYGLTETIIGLVAAQFVATGPGDRHLRAPRV